MTCEEYEALRRARIEIEQDEADAAQWRALREAGDEGRACENPTDLKPR